MIERYLLMIMTELERIGREHGVESVTTADMLVRDAMDAYRSEQADGDRYTEASTANLMGQVEAYKWAFHQLVSQGGAVIEADDD